MPASIHIYGLDTSVFVRLLTGHPEKDFQKTTKALEKLQEEDSSAELVVSNQVVGEAYITLQIHYSISKAEARAAILQVFDTGIILPLNGEAVLEILKSRGGAGLVDRLIANDYQMGEATILTNDKRMSRLPGAVLL